MASVVAGKFEDLVAMGLSGLVADDPDLELLAHNVPMSELEAVVREHEPSVLLLNFGALRAPDDLLRLHKTFPKTSIVILANRPTASECTQMLSFGATGCLSKETQARDIVNAIHLASRGMHVLPRSAAAGGGVDRLDMQGTPLTGREAEVLELLQDGCTNSVIAERLSIGVETVRTHARSIYRKLGVASRRDVVRMARQEPVIVDGERRPVAVS